MTKKQILICCAAGICLDGILRIYAGEDGNLLVHSAAFLAGAGGTAALIKTLRTPRT
ncbi:MAG: hypothetical protein SOI44_09080 [Lactimicrobium sp.]|jgi:hypothetical protein|uniref:hypothetical protein n=1 Tax=Lactimicrobium sp. TaxID=2563780 RepID=UPI002F353408